MAADQKVELELALRDSVSLTLKAMAANLEAINSKLVKGGEGISEGVNSLHKIQTETKGVSEVIKLGTKDVSNYKDSVVGLLSFMGGPVTKIGTVIAAGAVAAAKAISKVATERLQLKNLSEDTGLSENLVSIMMRAGKRMGFEPEVVNENIRKLGVALAEMPSKGAGPGGLFTELTDINEGKIAAELMMLTKQGKGAEALDKELARYEELRRTDPVQADKFAAALHVPPSFLNNLRQQMQGLQAPYKMSIEAAQFWAKRILEAHNLVERTTARYASSAIHLGLQILRAFRPNYVTIDPEERKRLGLPPLSPELIEQLKKEAEEQKKTAEEVRDKLKRFENEQRTKPWWQRQEGGPVGPGQTYLVGEQGPELFMSGGRFHGIVGGAGPELFSPSQSGRVVSNWEALNSALKQPWMSPAGQPEAGASGGGGRGTSLFGRPLYNYLKGAERDFETDEKLWGETERQWMDRSPRGGVPGARIPGEEMGQPISFGRDAIDRSGRTGSHSGQLAAEISFRNVPPGVTTTADGDGFDNFRVNKTRQLENI